MRLHNQQTGLYLARPLSDIIRVLTHFFLLLLLLSLPLIGAWGSGKPLSPFLAFPPMTHAVHPEKISWILFGCVTLGIVLTIAPFLKRMLTFPPAQAIHTSAYFFPAWGWVGVACLGITWLVAWTRLAPLQTVQLHTFTPLWLSYMAIVNALTMKRTGRCLIVHEPAFLVSLFPLSAGFWWIFEYLNRFVQNWYYLPGVDITPISYAVLASLSFSTVLPAIYSTYELLLTYPHITEPFASWRKVNVGNARSTGTLLLLFASMGLLGIGVWPTVWYPCLWISPLLMLVGTSMLQGKGSILGNLSKGDWRLVVTPALAGLICGFFWELWNWRSLAHWEYAIPHLHGLQIFEMPILGYAGYLPFGVECLVFIQFCSPRLREGNGRPNQNNRA